MQIWGLQVDVQFFLLFPPCIQWQVLVFVQVEFQKSISKLRVENLE